MSGSTLILRLVSPIFTTMVSMRQRLKKLFGSPVKIVRVVEVPEWPSARVEMATTCG
jgi:hypothetical protein